VPGSHNRHSSTEPPAPYGRRADGRAWFSAPRSRGKIVAIDLLADPTRLSQIDLVVLDV
jgi:hypothetical protein